MKAVLTGGIASGKSLFASFLEKEGVETLDADDVSHDLESPGGEAVAEIVREFGGGVLREDGGIDRAALAARVFGEGGEERRKTLERIIHPKVEARIEAWLAEKTDRPRIAVVPLLFESGWEKKFDFVVCVTAGESLRVARMAEKRGMKPQEARARIAAQIPEAEKVRRATVAVENRGSPEELAQKARDIALVLKRKKEEDDRKQPMG